MGRACCLASKRPSSRGSTAESVGMMLCGLVTLIALRLDHESGWFQQLLRPALMTVAFAAMGAARFSFHALCEQPLGAEDYLRIAREFHTLVLDRVPVMDFAQRNEASELLSDVINLKKRHRRSPPARALPRPTNASPATARARADHVLAEAAPGWCPRPSPSR